MKCSLPDRYRLGIKFKAVQPFLDENPDPTPQELEDAFGPPAEMACSLMTELA